MTEEEPRGFICRSIMEDMNVCLILQLDKEIEKLKKHIELGHKGSGLEPRDYPRELEVAFNRKKKTGMVFRYLTKQCPK